MDYFIKYIWKICTNILPYMGFVSYFIALTVFYIYLTSFYWYWKTYIFPCFSPDTQTHQSQISLFVFFGPTKSTFEVLFIHLFVFSKLFCETAHKIFYFLPDVWVSSNLQTGGSQFLEKKVLLWGFWVQNQLKVRFFSFYEKPIHCFCQIFYMKLHLTWIAF